MKCAPIVLALIATTHSCRGSSDDHSTTTGGIALRAAAPGETVEVSMLFADGGVSSVLLDTDQSGAVTRRGGRLRGGRPDWFLDTSRLPRGTAAADIEVSLRRVRGRARYRGRTNRRANIGDIELCGQRDQRSVVSFDRLGDRVVAVQCRWSRDGINAVETDLRIDRVASHSAEALGNIVAKVDHHPASHLAAHGTNSSWR